MPDQNRPWRWAADPGEPTPPQEVSERQVQALEEERCRAATSGVRGTFSWGAYEAAYSRQLREAERLQHMQHGPLAMLDSLGVSANRYAPLNPQPSPPPMPQPSPSDLEIMRQLGLLATPQWAPAPAPVREEDTVPKTLQRRSQEMKLQFPFAIDHGGRSYRMSYNSRTRRWRLQEWENKTCKKLREEVIKGQVTAYNTRQAWMVARADELVATP